MEMIKESRRDSRFIELSREVFDAVGVARL